MIKQPLIALAPNEQAPRQTHARWQAGAVGLYGKRQFGVPFLAATTRINIGAPRHVLQQMVVAGVMFHQPPVQILVEKS